jgi:hypothetical protein
MHFRNIQKMQVGCVEFFLNVSQITFYVARFDFDHSIGGLFSEIFICIQTSHYFIIV